MTEEYTIIAERTKDFIFVMENLGGTTSIRDDFSKEIVEGYRKILTENPEIKSIETKLTI